MPERVWQSLQSMAPEPPAFCCLHHHLAGCTPARTCESGVSSCRCALGPQTSTLFMPCMDRGVCVHYRPCVRVWCGHQRVLSGTVAFCHWPKHLNDSRPGLRERCMISGQGASMAASHEQTLPWAWTVVLAKAASGRGLPRPISLTVLVARR